MRIKRACFNCGHRVNSVLGGSTVNHSNLFGVNRCDGSEKLREYIYIYVCVWTLVDFETIWRWAQLINPINDKTDLENGRIRRKFSSSEGKPLTQIHTVEKKGRNLTLENSNPRSFGS